MSDSNRVSQAYVKETTYGVFPTAGPPTLKELRFVSESLAQENTTVTSQEIRADRQITGLLRTGIRVPGDLNFEFSYGAFDEWLDWALMDDLGFGIGANAAVTIAAGPSYTVTVPASVYTITRAAGSFITDGLLVNHWVEIRNFNDAGNNGYFKLLTVGALAITLGQAAGTPVAGGPETDVVIIQGAQIENGVLLTTFSGEKNLQDATAGSRFQQDLGMAIDRLSMTLPVDNIITGTFGLLGKRSVSAAATGGTGSNTAPAQNPVETGVDNVLSILEAGVPQQTISATFELLNNLRARLALGNLGAISMGTGTVNVTGKHTSYYTDKAIIDKALNQTESYLAYVLQESTGANAMILDWPKIKYSNGKRVAGGINTDVIADMDWTAYRHPTEDCTMRIVRFL